MPLDTYCEEEWCNDDITRPTTTLCCLLDEINYRIARTSVYPGSAQPILTGHSDSSRIRLCCFSSLSGGHLMTLTWWMISVYFAALSLNFLLGSCCEILESKFLGLTKMAEVTP